VSIEWKTNKYRRKSKGRYNKPSLIISIDMDSVDHKFIKKPCHHDNKNGIHMKCYLGKGYDIEREKWKSTNRKEKCRVIQRDEKSEGSFRYKETYFCVFTRIFIEPVANVLDFNHFFL
jgi:hypothetical protein